MTLSKNEKVGFTWWRLHEYLVGHRIRFEIFHGCFVTGFVGCGMAVLIEWQSMDPDIDYGASIEVSAAKGATVGLLLGVLTVLTNVFRMKPRMPVQTPETNDRMHSANLMRSFGIGTLAVEFHCALATARLVARRAFRSHWNGHPDADNRHGAGCRCPESVILRSCVPRMHPQASVSTIAFLNDAHRRGVLRQLGIEYQFRYVKLQEHPAESYRRTEGKGLALSASSSR